MVDQWHAVFRTGHVQVEVSSVGQFDDGHDGERAMNRELLVSWTLLRGHVVRQTVHHPDGGTLGLRGDRSPIPKR